MQWNYRLPNSKDPSGTILVVQCPTCKSWCIVKQYEGLKLLKKFGQSAYICLTCGVCHFHQASVLVGLVWGKVRPIETL